MAKDEIKPAKADETKPPIVTDLVAAPVTIDPASEGEGIYRVTMGDSTGEYAARDRNEAWAKFCDAHQTWPSPRRSNRVIEKVA